jgi:hypothetical protein
MKEESNVKKKLLATVAAAAVIASAAGFSTLAVAQGAIDSKSQGAVDSKSPAKPAATAEDQKSAPSGGGAMMHPQSGTQAPNGRAAQGTEQGVKPDQRLGQEQKTQTSPQRGAQEERGTERNGAQDERNGMQQKGVQGESGKSGVNASEQNAGKGVNSRGASVQLSQEQRSKIGTIIGHSSSARVTTNGNFHIAVGVAIPRSVHVEVLPEDIVELVPQYEGFDYIVVGDQILIVDPDSLEIVAIIET